MLDANASRPSPKFKERETLVLSCNCSVAGSRKDKTAVIAVYPLGRHQRIGSKGKLSCVLPSPILIQAPAQLYPGQPSPSPKSTDESKGPDLCVPALWASPRRVPKKGDSHVCHASRVKPDRIKPLNTAVIIGRYYGYNVGLLLVLLENGTFLVV